MGFWPWHALPTLGDLGRWGWADQHSRIDRPGAASPESCHLWTWVTLCPAQMSRKRSGKPHRACCPGPRALRCHFRGLCFTQRGLVRRERLGGSCRGSGVPVCARPSTHVQLGKIVCLCVYKAALEYVCPLSPSRQMWPEVPTWCRALGPGDQMQSLPWTCMCVRT